MTAITAFTKDNLKFMREDINKALEAVGAKYGITIVTGNATFTANRGTFKLEMSVGEGQDKTAVRLGKEAEALALYQRELFPDLKLDATYLMGGKSYMMVGYNTRARKNPLLVKCLEDGKVYTTTDGRLRRCTVK